MGGFFGAASKSDCVVDLFYGTDFHSHLGTRRGGLVVKNDAGYVRFIHDISNTQFRSKFQDDIGKMHGNMGLGVISDYEDQPLIISSHLGTYAIVTVGVIKNLDDLAQKAFSKKTTHFCEMSGGALNPTELVATLINQEATFEAGLERVQESIEGSCSILLLTEKGIYAARDKFGRTPIILGEKEDGFCATFESCALSNLNYKILRYLGPGEIVFLTAAGVEQKKAPGKEMRICSFLWVYYGYPASSYEDINVEAVRYRCGAALAKNDDAEADFVAGVPDSGVAHALGYANARGIPYSRPFVKYTPTWPRSFMPQDQSQRDLVAKMKLIAIKELIVGRKLLFCEDSIVRGTQLRDTISRIYDNGALQVHMRAACPPLLFGCPYLNFSRSRSEMDLAARRGIKALEGEANKNLADYANPCSDRHCAMVDWIGKKLGLTSLKYQKLEDLVEAIGLPKEKLCTYCWDGIKR